MLKALEILPGKLYQRGAFLDATLDAKREFLANYGITIVINFWHTADDEIKPYLYKYIHRFFHDSEVALPEAWLLRNAHTAARWIDQGNVILTHCYGGNNRSGLFNALIYRELTLVSGEQALFHIQSLKPRALHNKLYQDFLKGLPAL